VTASPTSGPTPGQTVGPFFGLALPFPHDSELVPPGTPGAVRLHGAVLDGAGEPVPDAILELWQAGPHGTVVQEPGSLRRHGGSFTGFGRSSTDAEGRYSFTTLVPGAPFYSLTVFARGLLDRLFTRAYLPGASDPFLEGLDGERRATLMAVADQPGPKPGPDPGSTPGYTFDVRLQGEGETVFLSYPRPPATLGG
jgi:protocatechuate 3,4-dioxygenase alpha subunit